MSGLSAVVVFAATIAGFLVGQRQGKRAGRNVETITVDADTRLASARISAINAMLAETLIHLDEIEARGAGLLDTGDEIGDEDTEDYPATEADA